MDLGKFKILSVYNEIKYKQCRLGTYSFISEEWKIICDRKSMKLTSRFSIIC